MKGTTKYVQLTDHRIVLKLRIQLEQTTVKEIPKRRKPPVPNALMISLWWLTIHAVEATAVVISCSVDFLGSVVD